MISRRQFVKSLKIPRPQLPTDTMVFREPLTEIDQAATLGTKGPRGAFEPRSTTAAIGTGDFGQRSGGIHRFNQRSNPLTIRLKTKQVTTGKWNENPGRSMAMSPGKPPLEAGHQLKIAPTTSRVPPNIINCFPIAGIAIA
jgi:hypothetical protein